MRLCDRDIEAWLDEGRLSINPRPPVERINGATVDVRLGNKFRTFRGHTAAFIDLSGPKDEVAGLAALCWSFITPVNCRWRYALAC